MFSECLAGQTLLRLWGMLNMLSVRRAPALVCHKPSWKVSAKFCRFGNKLDWKECREKTVCNAVVIHSYCLCLVVLVPACQSSLYSTCRLWKFGGNRWPNALLWGVGTLLHDQYFYKYTGRWFGLNGLSDLSIHTCSGAMNLNWFLLFLSVELAIESASVSSP